DITGFGLLGHAFEMADGSGVTLELESGRVPVLEEAAAYARKGILTGADARNRRFLEGRIEVASSVDAARLSVFFDAQTSGGMFVAVPASRSADLVSRLEAAGVLACRVGRVLERGEKPLRVL
ncbi:MAG: selenide, water dikinase SelD, partial [Candidatus Wallbacteria bacterium]|nr:selenide, water dikinase SelD [Candidatus Wallbacteria bacterium]